MLGSASARTSPNTYSVCPPMGGRKTSRSLRVTSSGYMPPVSLEQRPTQGGFGHLTRRAARANHTGLDGDLGDGGRGVVEQHAPSMARRWKAMVASTRQVDVRLGDGDRAARRQPCAR